MGAKSFLIATAFFCFSLFGWAKSHFEKRRIERELEPYIQQQKVRDSMAYNGRLVVDGAIDVLHGNYGSIIESFIREANRGGEIYFKASVLSLKWKKADFDARNARKTALMSGLCMVAFTVISIIKSVRADKAKAGG